MSADRARNQEYSSSRQRWGQGRLKGTGPRPLTAPGPVTGWLIVQVFGLTSRQIIART